MEESKMSKVDKKSRIALFLPSAHMGGAERVTISLANEMAERGYQADLILINGVGPLLSEISPKVNFIDLKCSRALRSIPLLVKYLYRNKPSALMATPLYIAVIAMIARMFYFRKLQFVVRTATSNAGEVVMAKNRLAVWSRRLTPLLYKLSSKIVVGTTTGKQEIISLIGVSPEKVSVVPNPVITPAFLSMVEQQVTHPWLGDKSQPVILFVGRLSKEKDIPTLLKALVRVRQSKNARVMLIGDGPDRAKLEEQAKALGIDNHVAFLGFVQNPMPYMRKADVFVLCSLVEGMPNALIQALAAGAPAVSTDCVTGPRDVLDNGRLGRLVPVGDSDALGDAIVETLDKPIRATREDLKNYEAGHVGDLYLDALGVPR